MSRFGRKELLCEFKWKSDSCKKLRYMAFTKTENITSCTYLALSSIKHVFRVRLIGMHYYDEVKMNDYMDQAGVVLNALHCRWWGSTVSCIRLRSKSVKELD